MIEQKITAGMMLTVIFYMFDRVKDKKYSEYLLIKNVP